MSAKNTVLLVTDFSYQAKGREYYREDVELSCFLRKFFNVCIAHISDMAKVLDHVDVVLLRNTGPQMLHHEHLMALRKRKDLLLFNDLLGMGDINGKGHLLQLCRGGFPVIPSFMSKAELTTKSDRYLIKPLNGADSRGVSIVNNDVLEESYPNALIQPLLDFEYEVSFYFIGKQFYYALYAPNKQKRWELQPYTVTQEDKDFAAQFISWNTCQVGIQRVDACRLKNGKLLLMEMEDYNPFLSLDVLQTDVKNHFLEGLCNTLEEML